MRRHPPSGSDTPTHPSHSSKNEWGALRALIPYLSRYRLRIAAAAMCLVLAKLANVGVPLVLKNIIDGLSTPEQMAVAVPFSLLVSYGFLRFFSTLFTELRDGIFARVSQRAIREAALSVFQHLHRLSLRFHLERQTGGMSRDIERGTRGIETL
jgi:ATP-binding cassette subfamily B protein